MRKRFRVPFLAAIVAAFVVPFGFALSLDSGPVASSHVRHLSVPAGAVATTAAAAAVTSSVVIATPPAGVETVAPPWHGMPDAAKLLLVGTVLFGLAAAVRRATRI